MDYDLTDFYLFKNCEDKLIKEINQNIQIRNAISGETIFNQGDTPKNLYIILEGSLYVTEFTEDGRSVAHELISKGCFGGNYYWSKTGSLQFFALKTWN